MNVKTNHDLAILVHSMEQTRRVGNRLGRNLSSDAVVRFFGELAAGKTTLIKAICEGMGVNPEIVISPTYTLTNIYTGRCTIFHVDLYRLEDAGELDFLDPDDWLNPSGPTLIEWPEKARAWLEEIPTLDIRLEPSSEYPETRTIFFSAPQGGHENLLRELSRLDLP